MRVYIISTYEENGAKEIEGTTNLDKLYDKVEAYLKARDISDECIFYAKNRIARDLNDLDKNESTSISLVDTWGGPVLDIIELED